MIWWFKGGSCPLSLNLYIILKCNNCRKHNLKKCFAQIYASLCESRWVFARLCESSCIYLGICSNLGKFVQICAILREWARIYASLCESAQDSHIDNIHDITTIPEIPIINQISLSLWFQKDVPFDVCPVPVMSYNDRIGVRYRPNDTI